MDRISKLRYALNSIQNASDSHSGADKALIGRIAERAREEDDKQANVERALSLVGGDLKTRITKLAERFRKLVITSHSPRTLNWAAEEIEKELAKEFIAGGEPADTAKLAAPAPKPHIKHWRKKPFEIPGEPPELVCVPDCPACAAPKPALPAEPDDTDLEGRLNTGADFPS